MVGLPVSACVDLSSTAVDDDGALATVLTWYDNEFDFSNRLLDVAAHANG